MGWKLRMKGTPCPLYDSDYEFGTEPNIETNVESGIDPNDEPIGRYIESRSKPNVETNAESGTDPNDEPIGSDTRFGSEPNVETNAESGTDPNDEPVGSDTECEYGFEEDDFSIDEEDVSETESIFHTPQFTEYTSQFETHFKETRVVSDNETEYSDSLHSVDESDSEHSYRKKRFPEFNTQYDMVHPMLKVVMIFANREVLKKAVINYGLRNRLHLKFKRNDLRRVNFISKPGCPWTLWASRYNPTVAEDLTWKIKTLKNEHSCSKDYGKINISSRTIAEKSIICLDGCHLKGYHEGHLLTVVGIDTNDCIYPIAFVVVENRQKGLKETLAEYFPYYEHRFCVRCWPTHAGGNIYQVACGAHNQYGVNLEAHTCSCRKWDLTGIQCPHAILVILMREKRLKYYVDECYKTKTQQAIYSHMIHPVRGPNQWIPHESSSLPILPPPIKRPPGRPHKNRRKEADETTNPNAKVSRKGLVMKCKKCGEFGHNMRTCKDKVGGNRFFHTQTQASTKTRQPKLLVKRRFFGTTKECATTTTAPTQEAPQLQQPSAIQVVKWVIGS
ncbi:hypothetical protein V6N13_009352 [Hibiscus sabdariffa]